MRLTYGIRCFLQDPDVTLPVCKDTQGVQMSDKKEVKLVLPKSLMVVLWVAAIGLVLNGVQPLLSSPANAVGGVQKLALCEADGSNCASLSDRGSIRVITYAN